MRSTLACLSVLLLGTAFASRDLSRFFATARPYVYKGGRPASPPSGCQVTAVSSVTRHGSRFPSSGMITGFEELAEVLAAHSANLTYRWMRQWSPRFSQEEEGMLSELGAKQLQAIGKRFAKNYRRLVSPYTPNVVVSTCTAKPRTAQTAAAFGLGAAGTKAWAKRPWVATSESKSKDLELRFFDSCSAYDRALENDSTYTQYNAFVNKSLPAIAAKVAVRTGLPLSVVTTELVGEMWDACNYEWTVLNVKRNSWCNVFDEEDASDLEFAEDITKYYECAYGTPIAYRIAAPLLSAMLGHLRDFALGTDTATARLRFAHAETVMPLFALLGLYKDENPLTATMSAQQREARLWRTSNISPMAASVSMVLASCNGTQLVQTIVSEEPISLPVTGCESTLWCPLTTVLDAYQDALETDFESICE